MFPLEILYCTEDAESSVWKAADMILCPAKALPYSKWQSKIVQNYWT